MPLHHFYSLHCIHELSFVFHRGKAEAIILQPPSVFL